MEVEGITHACAQCGEMYRRGATAKGQAYSWCRPCRNSYMRRYYHEHKPLGVHGPAKPKEAREPKEEWIFCRICGTLAHGRRTLCGSAECMAEVNREGARRRRRIKPPSHVKNKRQGDRNRRMRKRGVASEQYDPLVIAERDGWRCSLCRKQISKTERHPHPKALTMDHIVPISAGGDDAPHNVRACHSLCNSIKGNRVHGDGEQLMLVG